MIEYLLSLLKPQFQNYLNSQAKNIFYLKIFYTAIIKLPTFQSKHAPPIIKNCNINDRTIRVFHFQSSNKLKSHAPHIDPGFQNGNRALPVAD